ncbi:hypothetical protein BST61_g8052 [Cercospora zeina]
MAKRNSSAQRAQGTESIDEMNEWLKRRVCAERSGPKLPLALERKTARVTATALLRTTTVALSSVQRWPLRRCPALSFVLSVAWRVPIDFSLDIRIRFHISSPATRQLA